MTAVAPSGYAFVPAFGLEAPTPHIEHAQAPIRLLNVDGHPVTRWGLRKIADDHADMQVVGDCGTIAEALSLAAILNPTVVTIGLALLDGDGMTLARELRDRYSTLGIVILTGAHGDDPLFRALDSGASAFVSKMALPAEIIGAVRHASVAASSFTCSGLAHALRRRAELPKRPLLSVREAQVLQLLQDGKSVPEVAVELYVSLSTAKTYVARLYEKFGATNRAQALMTAVRLQLIEPPRASADMRRIEQVAPVAAPAVR